MQGRWMFLFTYITSFPVIEILCIVIISDWWKRDKTQSLLLDNLASFLNWNIVELFTKIKVMHFFTNRIFWMSTVFFSRLFCVRSIQLEPPFHAYFIWFNFELKPYKKIDGHLPVISHHQWNLFEMKFYSFTFLQWTLTVLLICHVDHQSCKDLSIFPGSSV